MTLVSNGAVGGPVTLALANFNPMLQREDGSYIGKDNTPGNVNAVALDGTLLWQKMAEDGLGGFFPLIPLYATADGGVIATSTGALSGGSNAPGTLVTFDQNGSVISQSPDIGAVLSWTGQAYGALVPSGAGSGPVVYSYGPSSVVWAPSFWPFYDANASGNSAASDIPHINILHDSKLILHDGVHREMEMEIVGPKVVKNFVVVQWMKGVASLNGVVPEMHNLILGRYRPFSFSNWTIDAPNPENVTYPLLTESIFGNRIGFEDDAGIKGVNFQAVVDVNLHFTVSVYRRSLFPFSSPRAQDLKGLFEPEPTVYRTWDVIGRSAIAMPKP